MSIIKKISSSVSKNKQLESGPLHAILRDYFLSMENEEEFPLNLAFGSLAQIETTAKSPEEMAFFFLEDIIFSSLYATYVETLIYALRDHTPIAMELIDKFIERTDEREREIATQTQNHATYITNFGQCPGCVNCEHHKDVDELVEYWETGDLEFFKTLFIGMQTIQFTFDYILNDLIPREIELLAAFKEEEILKFRQFVITYTENQLGIV